jgi:hypothetical protein
MLFRDFPHFFWDWRPGQPAAGTLNLTELRRRAKSPSFLFSVIAIPPGLYDFQSFNKTLPPERNYAMLLSETMFICKFVS